MYFALRIACYVNSDFLQDLYVELNFGREGGIIVSSWNILVFFERARPYSVWYHDLIEDLRRDLVFILGTTDDLPAYWWNKTQTEVTAVNLLGPCLRPLSCFMYKINTEEFCKLYYDKKGETWLVSICTICFFSKPNEEKLSYVFGSVAGT
jgi:hypothetical protein